MSPGYTSFDEEAARQTGKYVEVIVQEEAGAAGAGKTIEAIWALNGQDMRNAAGQSTDLNLGVYIAPVQSDDPTAIPVKPSVTAIGQENGLVLTVTASGTLLSPAGLTVPATIRTGITPGTAAALYQFNGATGTLNPIQGGTYTIAVDGTVSLHIPAGTRKGGKESYVLLTASTAQQVAPVGTGTGISHTIGKGDSLFRIAQRYGLRVSDLLALNPGINPEDLRVGSSINLPVR